MRKRESGTTAGTSAISMVRAQPTELNYNYRRVREMEREDHMQVRERGFWESSWVVGHRDSPKMGCDALCEQWPLQPISNSGGFLSLHRQERMYADVSAPRCCRFFCEVSAVRSSCKEEDGARNDALVRRNQ